MRLTGLEVGIFVAYIMAVIAIGFYSGRKGKKSTSNFFLAGRRLPWFVIGFSLIASSISTEQFLGEVGWGYKYGMAVCNWEWLCWPAQAMLLFFFLPIYLKSKIYTIPQYLGKRFGELSGTAFAVVCIMMYLIINLPLVLYSGGFLIEEIFGINKYWAVCILVAAAGSYTIFGGLSAVAWVDLFNGVLLIVGGLFVFILGVMAVPGGLPAIVGTGDRAHLMLPADHPELPWTAMIVVALVTGGFYYSTNQYITQRCLGAKTEWDGKMGIVLAAFLAIPLALSVTWPGMIAYALNPNLEDVDKAYPFLVHELVPIGLRGIVFAALIGAIMSTIDSLVNSTSSLLTLDIYKKHINKGASDKDLVKFAQKVGFFILVFGAAWTPMIKQFESIFDYVQDCWVMMMAPCMAVFVLAILWKRATNTAAIVTLFSSIPILIFVFIRQAFKDNAAFREHFGFLADINTFNLGGIVFVISLFAVVAISLLTKPVEPEQLKTTIWKRKMLKLPEEETMGVYPWWRRIGLWWAVLVVVFVIIYIKYW